MSKLRLMALTAMAMTAFAGNSLLCRMALQHTGIDAGSFTTIRLMAGALTLWLLVSMRGGAYRGNGNWSSAIALFAYAAGFSYAYVRLPAGTGALILFGAVQATMIGHGIWSGERLRKPQVMGVVLAFAGIIGLLLPGLSAPPIWSAMLMSGAGVAWGIYSLRGRGAGDPTRVTAGNFLRAAPIAAILSLVTWNQVTLDAAGIWYAIASGALASGIGYAIWYTALPSLRATQAATLQLSVPVIATVGAILFLGEALTLRLVLASFAILGGIAVVIRDKGGDQPVLPKPTH